MKQLTAISLSIITLLTFAFSGCDKNTFTPGEDNDAHPIVWQYKYNQHQIYSDVIPAMDENGNIFFSIQNAQDEASNVYVFAIDKDGNALWDKPYNNSSGVVISRVMYIDNKVIYTVLNYDPLSYYQETIYCLNAADGSEIWQYSPDFKNEWRIEAMAVTSNYVVVGAKWGESNAVYDNLHYFDLTSGVLTKSVDLGYHNVKQLSIVGNSVYLGTEFPNNLKSYSAPKIIKMDLASDNILWTFNPEYEAEHTYIFENRSIAVDDNGRAFCIIRKQYGVEPSNIYIINDDGTLSTTVPIIEHNESIFNILIDKDNNFYSAIPTYAKYSPDGGKIWDFYTGTTVPNSNFRTGCILGDNDFVYHAEYGGILNVNTTGEIAWAKYDDTQFTYPSYPLLTNDGNMVVVGDVYVSCIKGDGAKIQDAPWPRIYQNNGNTSSR